MADIKIINLPTEKEVVTPREKKPKALTHKRAKNPKPETEDGDYAPPKKRYLVLLLLLLAGVIAYFVYHTVCKYQEYDINATYAREDSAETAYEDFKGNLLKYSNDGVLYTSYSGSIIWNQAYSMATPTCDLCQDYVAIYDKKGTEIYLFDASGLVTSLSVNEPIIEARVSNKGVVALFLQDRSASYIRLFDKKGSLLASGAIHPQNSGYPLSIALSSDATKLLVSLLSIKNGEVEGMLEFYDFSAEGKTQIDNISASYTYKDTIFPRVEFVKNDNALAFSDKQVLVFNNNFKNTLSKEVIIEDEIKSIAYNDSYYGFITEHVAEDGTIENKLTVYNMFGLKRCEKTIDHPYSRIEILSNNEVVFYDEQNINIYNLLGIKKFEQSFSTNVYKVISEQKDRKYYLIQERETNEVKIK